MLECSSSVRKRRMKKKKKNEEENVDMISHLPDPLLHHIFSFLDITQAIQTCILSKRWRYFWVSLPTLNFNYNSRQSLVATCSPKTKTKPRTRNNKSNFLEFVDRVLLLRDNSSNIQKLSVVSKRRFHIAYRLNTWILTSVVRHIQQLTLQIFPTARIWELPHCLNNCKSLTNLALALHGHSTLILPGPLCSFTLPRLNSLSIENVIFEENLSINGFLSDKCLPVLETLILLEVHFRQGSSLKTLNISSFKLKHLRLKSPDYRMSPGSSVIDIHLDSPNLISFYYEGSIFKYWFSIEKLSSDIQFSNECQMDSEKKICYAQQTANILSKLHNVEQLTLSLDSHEFFTEVPELFGNLLFLKLKCLKLERSSALSLELFRVTAYILNACPNIETLCLRGHCEWQKYYPFCGCRYCREENASSPNQGDCWEAGLSLECLKVFEFRKVRACVKELEFIENLLNKAVVLEKLFIVFGFGKSSSDDKKCRDKFKKKFVDQDDDEANKFLSLPSDS